PYFSDAALVAALAGMIGSRTVAGTRQADCNSSVSMVSGLRVRAEISTQLWASRRPHGKARGARIPGVCKRRATKPGGMHRRPEWCSCFRTGPKSANIAMSQSADRLIASQLQTPVVISVRVDAE